MDDVLHIVKDYATIINSVLLIVLLFKYALDIRKQRLEYEKLERELKALRDREAEATQKILAATQDDLRRYVIDPMVEAIHRREEEIQSGHHNLLSALYEASRSIKNVYEASVVGHELALLMERNLQVIERFAKCLTYIEEHIDEKKKNHPYVTPER